MIPSRRNRQFLIMALVGLVAVAGCSRKAKDGAASGGGGRPSMPPMPVETAEVKTGTLVDQFTVVGSLDAKDAITVVSEINGTVVALPFHEGQSIEKGGLIVQLDDDELKAQLDRAIAVRDQRQSSYDRTKAVVDQAAGAAQDLDDAAAALKVAEADRALAQTLLDKTRIIAPFGGIAGIRRVSLGTYATAGMPITDLVRVDELRVDFTAPERLLGKLRRGAEVTVTTTAYPSHVVKGTIDIIDPRINADTRSAHIVARIANPDLLLRPGMSATITVVLSSLANALTVPSEAVILQGGKTMVYVVQADSTVAPRPVTLGLRQPETVEVVSGLEAGERVVRAGHQKIFPGAKVMPIASQEGASQNGAGQEGGA